MSGRYVYRAPVAHRCDQPMTGEAPGPHLGDVWRRDDCGRYWRLENRWWWCEYEWVRVNWPIAVGR